MKNRVENYHQVEFDQFLQIETDSEISGDQHETGHSKIGKAVRKDQQIPVHLRQFVSAICDCMHKDNPENAEDPQ